MSKSFYLVSRGMVRVAKTAASGKQVTITTRHKGEAIGIMALIRGTHSATATALEDTDVLAISRDDFLTFVASNPSIWHKLLLFIE